MKVQEVVHFLEELSPLAYAEKFDNVGLLVGDTQWEVTGILVALDTLEAVVEEAIEKKYNLIVSFHPIIFDGLKKITGKNYVERVVMKALQHNIAIFAIHTALDNNYNGVNATICEALSLQNRKILLPQSETIRKLITFVPEKNASTLLDSLFQAGAGKIGNYNECSFSLLGTGTFKGNEFSQPAVGEKEKRHYETEVQIGVIFPRHLEQSILKVLWEAHPYEEVAYELYTLSNHQNIGLGMVGELPQAISEEDFLYLLKEKFHLKTLRFSKILKKNIKKVAVLGGSGAFAIDAAKSVKADAYVSADFKYHDFFKAENQILLVDIGHYESEQYVKKLLFEKLSEKFPNFALSISQENTNPVNYL